ncbi:MAG TPA: YcxB family protein [Clostridia bacterium]
MEINYTLTKNDLKDYYKSANRNTFIAWGVVILISAALIIIGLVLKQDGLLFLCVFTGAFSVLYLLLTVIKIFTVYKNSLKTIANEVSIEIEPDFFRIKKSGKVRWEYIFDLIEFKNSLALKLNKNSVFIIPKRVLDEQARSLIKEYYKEGLKKRKTLKNKK